MSPTTTATYGYIEEQREQQKQEQPQRLTPTTYREDCWSAEETHALIEAWGSLHLSLNRGSLRQQQWSQVSAAVNEANHDRRPRRSDVQCKNRIDTLKKKYKVEKGKVASDVGYVSAWTFFSRLDFLISGERAASEKAPGVGSPRIPVRRRSALPKRPARWLRGGGGWRRKRGDEGWRTLAGAIRRLGEVYERVESMKQEKVIELEKHRMQFAKDLEFQRIQLLMDTHLQLLSRIKRPKHLHHQTPLTP